MASHRGPRPRRRWSAIAGVVPLLLLPLGPSAAAQEGSSLYEWTDDKGVVRYTPDPGRVPRGSRASMRLVAPGAWAAPAVPEPRTGSYEGTGQAAGSAPEPPPSTLEAFGVATPAPPPGEPLVEADPFNAPSASRSVQGEEIADRPPAGPPVGAAADPSTRSAGPAPRTAADSSGQAAAQPPPRAAADPWQEGTGSAAPVVEDPRIAELEAAIARDEERLKELISIEGEGLESDLELREIGQRLPQLHRELRELRARSGAVEP